MVEKEKCLQAMELAKKYITPDGSIRGFVYSYTAKTAKNGKKETTLEPYRGGNERSYFCPATRFIEIGFSGDTSLSVELREEAIAKLKALSLLGYFWVKSVLEDFQSLSFLTGSES